MDIAYVCSATSYDTSIGEYQNQSQHLNTTKR